MSVPLDAIETALIGDIDGFVTNLAAFCAIPSVSTDPAFGGGIARAADFVADQLRRAGLEGVQLVSTGGHPLVTGHWLHAADAPTILVYGHYDVQPPDPLEQWTSPPFELTLRHDRLYARGVSDDKGPLLLSIAVVGAFLRLRGTLPVNLKFMIEGEEETGSPHLAQAVAPLKALLACDLVVSADGAMWRPDLPTVTVASRGLVALEIVLQGASKDLHSGRHGGSAPNAVQALVGLLASLHDQDGHILVDGFHAGATPPDPAILSAIAAVNFDASAYYTSIGLAAPFPSHTGATLLRRQWVEPTIEFNGLSGGYSGSGSKTIIPATASAKITCRLVAGQEPGRVRDAIARHIQARSPSGFKLDIIDHGPGTTAFALDPDSAGLKMIEDVLFGILGSKPLRVAMGATIPVGAVLKEHLAAPTVYFSFSTSDEDYHAPNEFFRVSSIGTGLIGWARLLEGLKDLPR